MVAVSPAQARDGETAAVLLPLVRAARARNARARAAAPGRGARQCAERAGRTLTARVRGRVGRREGASASYFCDWEAKVGESIELCAVQLPGREARRHEQPSPTLQDAAYELVAACAELFEDPAVSYAFFGHSMGSWLAYEVCRELRRCGLRDPALLVVSDFPAPQTPEEERPWDGSNAEMAELDFQQECRDWGLPEALFLPETWNIFAEMLRRDFELFDSYVFEPLPRNEADEAGEHAPGRAAACALAMGHVDLTLWRARACRAEGEDNGVDGGGCLGCPIATFISEIDPKVGPKGGAPALMEEWANLSRRRNMSVDVFPGDHYYLGACAHALLLALAWNGAADEQPCRHHRVASWCRWLRTKCRWSTSLLPFPPPKKLSQQLQSTSKSRYVTVRRR